MPTVRIPDDASVEHLRKLARRLQRGVRSGAAAAVDLVTRRHPAGAPADPARFPLTAAQLAVARELGFASWPRLREHLDLIARLRRDPDADPGAGPDAGPDAREDPADEFCRLACLVYGRPDGPERWARARALLRPAPDLPARSVWAAAAASDPDRVAGHLAADRALAGAPGGPYGWEPLLYLTYSRVDPRGAGRTRCCATARLLLDAGADPDAGYLWHGLVPPFTALTGAFGEGEQGPGRQPRHPHSLALARLLLDAGADPNDGQTLYNRMFRPDDDHLELLFEYGLGRGDGGPWQARLGGALETPAEMLARPFTWAAEHGFTERVRLLLRHGVDARSTAPDGRAAVELAAAGGHSDDRRAAGRRGCARPELTGVDALVAAVLAADADGAARLAGADPDLLAAARAERPAVVAEAVQSSRGAAVELAVRLGFDVNALAGGQTALHSAAWDGDLPLVRRLVELGADPGVRDRTFDGTPLGWARARAAARGGRLPGSPPRPRREPALPGTAATGDVRRWHRRGPAAARSRARVAVGGNGSRTPTPCTSQPKRAQPGAVDQLGGLAGPLQRPQRTPAGSVRASSTGGRRGSTPSANRAARWSSSRVSVAPAAVPAAATESSATCAVRLQDPSGTGRTWTPPR